MTCTKGGSLRPQSLRHRRIFRHMRNHSQPLPATWCRPKTRSWGASFRFAVCYSTVGVQGLTRFQDAIHTDHARFRPMRFSAHPGRRNVADHGQGQRASTPVQHQSVRRKNVKMSLFIIHKRVLLLGSHQHIRGASCRQE